MTYCLRCLQKAHHMQPFFCVCGLLQARSSVSNQCVRFVCVCAVRSDSQYARPHVFCIAMHKCGACVRVCVFTHTIILSVY